MSGAAPRRLHDDSGGGGHSVPLKRSLEDANSVFPGLSGKLAQHPPGNDFQPSYESGLDGRLMKIQRIDTEKRPLIVPRTPFSSSNAGDHAAASDSRLEFRNPKDARDVRVDHKDAKAEMGDSDVRMDSKFDGKETRADKVSLGGIKGDVKFDKDAMPNSYLPWKDSKESHRGKRYFEPPNDGFDSWRVARHVMQNSDDVSREAPVSEDWVALEAREAVGENRIDLKAEDKFREKERKRKDEKHREHGEKDRDRSERRNIVLPVSGSNDRRDQLREERDPDRWDRDRKDAVKYKERHDREADATKLEPSVLNETGSLHHGREAIDGPSRTSELENTTSESKSLKDDTSKAYDRDLKDKKRERETEVAEKPEQRVRSHDKELDDFSAEGCGAMERDKEAFGHGIHQRRRMIRSRGASQTPNKEARFRSKTHDNDGTQGKSEVSSIVYKAGECMQELIKSWKEFEVSQESKNEGSQNYPTLEIRIPAEYVTTTNHQVRGGQLWGTDVYTNDSDLVAVLMHTGYCRRMCSSPPPAIHELWATIRVLPPQESYTSTFRNYVRSRSWGAGIGCSFRVERCCIVKKGGGTIELEPRLAHISAVEPTLAPASVERMMTTRAAASNTLRQQRFVREVTIQYNLCNEPWLKYSISVVADKGLKKPFFTSACLKKGEVLYLETHFKRYELCFNGERTVCNGALPTPSEVPQPEQEKLQNHNSHVNASDKNPTDRESIIDTFRWSLCKKPLPQNVTRAIGIPLPTDHLEVLEDGLCWEDVHWSQTGVWVAGKEYVLARAHFLSPK